VAHGAPRLADLSWPDEIPARSIAVRPRTGVRSDQVEFTAELDTSSTCRVELTPCSEGFEDAGPIFLT
jgi:hypothetical protein